MKAKLDENIGRRGIELFRNAGHDIETVADEQLTSASDETVLDACVREGRCLVTLDLDFANPLRFPTKGTPGIAVLRTSVTASLPLLLQLCGTLLKALSDTPIDGQLWIVEHGRIRRHAVEE